MESRGGIPDANDDDDDDEDKCAAPWLVGSSGPQGVWESEGREDAFWLIDDESSIVIHVERQTICVPAS